MKHLRLHFPSMLCGALALGCGSETDGSTTTTSTTSGDGSGTVTSAPGSATDETASDSAPTMATITSGSTTEACSFANCDDMNRTDSCDPFTQDCPEGQKCAAGAADGSNSWNALKCVDVTGTGEPGDDCTVEGHLTGIDSCIEGTMCWSLNEDGIGTCVGLCTGSAEAPVCPAGSCTISGTLNLCLSNCDPLLQDCPGTDVCIPYGVGFVCLLDVGGEEGQTGDPCEFANVCDAGLICIEPATASASCDPAAGGCCTPFCPFPDGACPNPDQQCVQWFDPAMLPANDPRLGIGVCAVPF